MATLQSLSLKMVIFLEPNRREGKQKGVHFHELIFFLFIIVTGMDDPNSPFISLKDALKDAKRIKYHHGYLTNLLASIKY